MLSKGFDLQQKDGCMSEISRSATRVKGFEDAEMDFQLMRQMGVSSAHASSIGESLALACQIPDGEPTVWVDAFEGAARRQREDALVRLKKGHVVSAKQQLFKACNSFRAAEYYSPCGDERHASLGRLSRECFIQAINLSGYFFEAAFLDFKSIRLPCYFIAPSHASEPRKTLIIVSGFDGTLEEEYFFRGKPALERGYNVVLMAGPGQMDVFREYPQTYFEPDYEAPLATVMNYLESRGDIDFDRLGLMGISFGGYFATRAAAHDGRVKALIANSPILDLHAYLSAFTGMQPDRDLSDQDDFKISDLEYIPENVMSNQLKAQSEHLMRRFGGLSFKQTFIYLKEFRLGESIEEIQCPCLALCGSGEGREPMRQYQQFCQQTKADAYLFQALEGADTHCQVGNPDFSAAVAYDWLDERFAD